MDLYSFEEMLLKPVSSEVSLPGSVQAINLSKHEINLARSYKMSVFGEEVEECGNSLDTYPSQIDLHNAGNISAEQSQNTAQYCPFESENMYNCNHLSEDQTPFLNPSFQRAEDVTLKKIKKSHESETCVPFRKYEDETIAEEQKDKKKQKPKAKDQVDIPEVNPMTCENDCDPLFHQLNYHSTIKCDGDHITVEVNVEGLPQQIKAIGANEAKNFLKSIGDIFFDEIYGKKIACQALLKKDCLSSLAIWNSLFNPKERTKFESKDQLRKLMKGLKMLENEIDGQRWIALYFEFLESFNPKEFRTQDSIEKPERKLLYEMLARVMIQGQKIIQDILDQDKRVKIVSFEIVRVHKEKGVFRFQTNSPDFGKIFESNSSKKSNKRSKKANLKAQEVTPAAKSDLFEIEQESEHPVAFESLHNIMISAQSISDIQPQMVLEEREENSYSPEELKENLEEVVFSNMQGQEFVLDQGWEFDLDLSLPEGNTIRADERETLNMHEDFTSFICYEKSYDMRADFFDDF